MDQLANQEENKMKPFEKCPVCGGEMIAKAVDKIIRGGVITRLLSG